ncbi:MAG: iron-containing alcohol dehydrogenase [Acutalibacteraceae bacterium]
MRFNMYVPTRFIFGNGRLSELSQYKMPGKKAMIVTTNGTSVFKNGAYDNTVEQLNKAGVTSVLFNEVQANPLKSTVMWCCVCKENQCDFIVALGGGSVMDAAKAMAFMAAIRVTYGIILWAEAEKVSPCRRNRFHCMYYSNRRHRF